jgi:four helix bundle protein
LQRGRYGHCVEIFIESRGSTIFAEIGLFSRRYDACFPAVMNQKALALQARTRAFARRVIELCEGLPTSAAANSIKEQLIDSSGSTDSNYRAACRARTRKEFIAKLGVVIEESDESLGWLELLIDSSICATEKAKSLANEANELVSIFVKSELTAKNNYEAELKRGRQSVRKRSRRSTR